MKIEWLLDFQISVEKRVAAIYQKIGDSFSCGAAPDGEWITFWRRLAADERDHAALLSIEKEFLQTGVCVQRSVEVDQKVRQEIDLLLSTCEEKVGPGLSEEEAIQILVALEESEAHNLLYVLLNMTDSKVLSHFAAFSESLKQHEARIQQWIRERPNDRKREKTPWAGFAKTSGRTSAIGSR